MAVFFYVSTNTFLDFGLWHVAHHCAHDINIASASLFRTLEPDALEQDPDDNATTSLRPVRWSHYPQSRLAGAIETAIPHLKNS